jgi:hypothetical protein
MVFIYCNWVSSPWQRSVNWYKTRKQTAIYRSRNSTQTVHNTIKKYKNHKIHKIEKNSKEETNTKMNIKKLNRVIRKQQREANNNEI